MPLRLMLATTLSLIALPASADRIPTETGTFVSADPGPLVDNSAYLGCPDKITVDGTKASFQLYYEVMGKPFPFGTVSVDLGTTGSFHDVVTLPPRKPYPASSPMGDEDQQAAAAAKQVYLDFDTIEVGGGGRAALIGVHRPDHSNPQKGCTRTLMAEAPLRSSAGAKNKAIEGSYWTKGGGGHGGSHYWPQVVTISGGTIDLVFYGKYNSWAVRNVAITPKGTFATKVKLAKMPPESVLTTAGYYEQEITGADTLTVTGTLGNKTDGPTGKSGKTIDVHVESSDGQDFDATYFHKGFNTTTLTMDCRDPATRARHRANCYGY